MMDTPRWQHLMINVIILILSVSCSIYVVCCEVNIYLETSSDQVKITIIDNGPGFPEDVIDNIGQPYISSKKAILREKSGLGLGTFIGKTLLERQKAFLDFSNLKKGGAKVNINWNISDITI